MRRTQAIVYGRQFAAFYDRLFPGGDPATRTAAWLAERHPGRGLHSLELGVGSGRIALPLAERTDQVVGVDLSPDMLALLREALDCTPAPVTPVEADIRTYRDDRRYGLVYCICGTFSMELDPAGQQEIVDTCARAVAADGAVVIETHNPAWIEAMHEGRSRDSFFTPYPGRDTGLLSYSALDVERRLWQLSHIWFEDGGARIASEASRLTSAEELDAYAARAGLRREAHYGDWQGSPLTDGSANMVCVYRP